MQTSRDRIFKRSIRGLGFAVIVGSGLSIDTANAKDALAVTATTAPVVTVNTPGIGTTPIAQAPAGWEAATEKYAPYIEHESDVWIGKTPYRLLKLNYGKGELTEIAIAPDGREFDPEKIHEAYRGQFERFGRIHPTLHRALGNAPQEYFDVMVWLEIAPPRPAPKPEELSQGYEEEVLRELGQVNERELAVFDKSRNEAIAALGIASAIDPEAFAGTPFVRVPKLSRAKLEELAKSQLVKMLLSHEPEGREDLATSMAISNADDVQAIGITGNGVKVAVWEQAPASTTNLNVTGSYSASAGITPGTSNHAQHVSATINNSTAVSGYGPATTFYSADSYNIAALDWAIDSMRVSAINQSFHRNAEIFDGLQADDLYKDYKVLQYPWPTIVHAAGNWCGVGTTCYEMGSDVTDEWVNHKGFNTISIGNHDDTASQMSASSCFVNPSSAHNDRELPELSANGTNVTADGILMSGTSMSSPAVTGSVTLLQERAPVLRIWPEGVRALLFAGATINVATHAGTLAGGGAAANAPNTWWRDVSLGNDAFDGAGALNIGRSDYIAQRRWNGKDSASGWDIGRMTEQSFERRFFEREYRVSVPRSILLLRPHVKVALAWNGTSTVSGSGAAAVYASELGMDLDIRVYDSGGTQVAYSLSWDNSYEIVDFDATPGETYTIKVHRWSTKPGAWTWFGIAWDTTWKSRFQFPFTIRSVSEIDPSFYNLSNGG